MGKIFPKEFDTKVLKECIAIICYRFRKQNDDITEPIAYNFIVDAIINNNASELLRDLYENDKITLREVIKRALIFIKNNNLLQNKIAKRVFSDA